MTQIFHKLFFYSAFIIFCSCGSPEKIKEDQLTCFQKYLLTIQNTQDFIEVRIKFLDTLNKWESTGINEVQGYKKTKWRLDSAVFFNEPKNKALLLIVDQHDSFSNNDDVKIIAAEKIKNKWNFYFMSYPELIFKRGENREPLSLDYLSNEARFQILSDGYFKGHSCRINSKYIESEIWFSDWRRKMHKDFLKDTLPLDIKYINHN